MMKGINIMEEMTNNIIEEVNVTENGEVSGNVKISDEVIATIAGIATEEIKGVAGMYGSFTEGIAEKLGAKKSFSKGVKVEMLENAVIIDLDVIVEYGAKIPDISWEIQENVKNNIETMTGLLVEKVNIHVEGVSFEKQKETDDILISDTKAQ